MKVGVISNNDLCLPLLFFLNNNKAETNLYFGTSPIFEPKREDVLRFCSNYKISCSNQAKKSETVSQWANQLDPDLLFVIGHRQKIDIQKTKARLGMYNIHFGKLPQYRGSSPVFWQMKNNDSTLGLSIHKLTDEMDAGPVHWQKVIKNEEHFSHNYVQYLFSNLLLEGVNEIIQRVNDASFQPIEQDETSANWYSRPTLKDVLIMWDSMPAAQVCSLVRACNNWNAGAITLYQGMEMKIIDASYAANTSTSTASPGTITSITESIKVSSTNGDEVSIHYLSLNSIPFAGRQAKYYGIVEGEKLTYHLD
jgi:methionyl-tRNA formyltransferase